MDWLAQQIRSNINVLLPTYTKSKIERLASSCRMKGASSFTKEELEKELRAIAFGAMKKGG